MRGLYYLGAVVLLALWVGARPATAQSYTVCPPQSERMRRGMGQRDRRAHHERTYANGCQRCQPPRRPRL